MSNLAPDSSLCRAAAPRLRPLQLLLPDCIDLLQLQAAPCLRPLQLLLAACVCLTAPRLHPLQLLLPDCVHFVCCSPIRGGSRGGGGGTGGRCPPLLLLHRFIFLLTNLLPLRCNSSSARNTVHCLKPNGLGTRPRSSIPLRVRTYYVRERNLSKEEAHGGPGTCNPCTSGTCSAKHEGATRAHPEK